jgi:hypothetical protein
MIKKKKIEKKINNTNHRRTKAVPLLLWKINKGGRMYKL